MADLNFHVWRHLRDLHRFADEASKPGSASDAVEWRAAYLVEGLQVI